MIVLSPPNALQAKTQKPQRSWTSLMRSIVDRFGIARSRTFGLNLQSMADRVLVHRLVGAQRDHDVEDRRLRTDLREDTFEKHSQGAGSSRIRDNQEHFFPGIPRLGRLRQLPRASVRC